MMREKKKEEDQKIAGGGFCRQKTGWRAVPFSALVALGAVWSRGRLSISERNKAALHFCYYPVRALSRLKSKVGMGSMVFGIMVATEQQ
jgi:hypothetical protein